MNQHIKTSFGVIIILIVAITAGFFVWLSQKNNPIETETRAVTVNPIKNQKNKTADLKTKTNNERCENVDKNNIEQSEACFDYYSRLDEAQKSCAAIDNEDIKKLEECYNYYGLTAPMNNINWIIFSTESLIPGFEIPVKEANGRFTPSEQDIQKALPILEKTLNSDNNLRPLKDYKAQFFGYKNEQGEKIIRGNYFCSTQADWKSKVVYVFDGGNCYFRADVNLDTPKVFNISVNGES